MVEHRQELGGASIAHDNDDVEYVMMVCEDESEDDDDIVHVGDEDVCQEENEDIDDIVDVGYEDVYEEDNEDIDDVVDVGYEDECDNETENVNDVVDVIDEDDEELDGVCCVVCPNELSCAAASGFYVTTQNCKACKVQMMDSIDEDSYSFCNAEEREDDCESSFVHCSASESASECSSTGIVEYHVNDDLETNNAAVSGACESCKRDGSIASEDVETFVCPSDLMDDMEDEIDSREELRNNLKLDTTECRMDKVRVLESDGLKESAVYCVKTSHPNEKAPVLSCDRDYDIKRTDNRISFVSVAEVAHSILEGERVINVEVAFAGASKPAFPDSQKLLNHPNVWVADTAASKHMTSTSRGLSDVRRGTTNMSMGDESTVLTGTCGDMVAHYMTALVTDCRR